VEVSFQLTGLHLLKWFNCYTLLTQLFVKPSITFGCSGTTRSLKINRISVARISKGTRLH